MFVSYRSFDVFRRGCALCMLRCCVDESRYGKPPALVEQAAADSDMGVFSFP